MRNNPAPILMSATQVADELCSYRYGGGYTYPGSTVSPGRFQGFATSGGSDDLPDVEGARAWVDAAPVGAEVHAVHDFGEDEPDEFRYRKTAAGWVLL